MARVAAHSDSEESVKDQSKPAEQEDNGKAADPEGESEYEIEEVLDAKRGVFPDGRMGYFVKWKGYGSSENSWVDEQDAFNAQELVDEFWRKKKKTPDKKTPDKSRKSVAMDDADVAEVRPKKRGRKSIAQTTKSDSDMEVDAPQPQPKKPRKSQAKKPQEEGPPEQILGDMSSFMHLASWEGLIETVDTVERESDNSLTVYFTLNSGECVKESSVTCNKRFPQSLLRFYESNLKWRTVEEMQ